MASWATKRVVGHHCPVALGRPQESLQTKRLGLLVREEPKATSRLVGMGPITPTS